MMDRVGRYQRESPQARANRKRTTKIYLAKKKAAETPAERETRKLLINKKYANQTPEQRATRARKQKEYFAIRAPFYPP